MSAILGEHIEERFVSIATGEARLEGSLTIPHAATGIVVFAHGSGSSRHSPRNRHVAHLLGQAGLATLLFDLLTAEEEVIDQRTSHLRFDIDLLARRLTGATDWLEQAVDTQHLRVGYFGASTGAAAALIAAASRPGVVSAVVARGGRPDLAGQSLGHVHAPTLLIVGERDPEVLALNRSALARLASQSDISIVYGATHLFEEPGALDEVARLASEWFRRHLVQATSPTP